MDRRLGRPLPHQLPNPTRADPSAINLSSLDRIRYYSQFPRAIPNQRVRSHALLTRPPLPRKGARLACVRPAASVRSEPGSNSQVESTEVLSLTSNLRTSVSSPSQEQDQSLLHVPSRSREQRDPQVVKLTPRSSEPKSLLGRYAAIRRRCAQTARISLH